MDNADYTFNENGIPCCPHNPSLPMKWEGNKSHPKSRLPTMKFVCSKMKWDDTYKIRVNVEKSINHFKDSFCVTNHKTPNEKTLHADLLLADISQLSTVVVADKIIRGNILEA